MTQFNAQFLFDEPARAASPKKAYVHATACDLAYSRETAWVQRFAEWGGFDNFIIRDTPTAWTPNYVVFRSQRGMLVAFSGTENWAQVREYLILSSTEKFENFPPERVMRAFKGMYRAIARLLSNDIGIIGNDTPLVFCGHSLGGAMAVLAAIEWRRTRVVRNVWTFGCPKMGNNRFRDIRIDRLPLIQWRNAGDVIPLLPFDAETIPVISHVFELILHSWYDFEELGPANVLDEFGYFQHRWQSWWENWFQTFVDFYRGPHSPDNPSPTAIRSFQQGLKLLHSVLTYKDRVFLAAQRRGMLEDLQALVSLNRDIARNQFFSDPIQRQEVDESGHAIVYFSDPIAPPPPDPEVVPLDPPQLPPITRLVPRTIVAVMTSGVFEKAENVQPAPPPNPLPPFDPLRFETGPRRDWLHKATDRRMLLKAWQVLLAIQARDTKLAEAQAQGRQLELPMILDPDDPKLLRAFADVLDQVELALSLHYA